MKALHYKVTKIPASFTSPIFKELNYGFAYKTQRHYIHLYCEDTGLNPLFFGFVTIEKITSKSLEQWVQDNFGAEGITHCSADIGNTISGIWRPGLEPGFKLTATLGADEHDLRSHQQALLILTEKLNDLLLYIEPEGHGLTTYSHKTRELLILACTEVECHWAEILRSASITQPPNGFKTSDYVKIENKAHLKEFEVKLINYRTLPAFVPFLNWNSSNPTKSLLWYDAYNKTKHDRRTHFSAATLDSAINAVAACVIMFCSRFGPDRLQYNSQEFSNTLELSLNNIDRKSFYIPLYNLPEHFGESLHTVNLIGSIDFSPTWKVKKLII